MTSRYRVEYSLKSHRRDLFIEWIKSLLAVPFVLHSNPNSTPGHGGNQARDNSTREARRRYAECMKDVEGLIEDHIAHTQRGTADSSRLRLLVPSVGTFFTPLPLQEAFCEQDNRRHISSRRFVAPVSCCSKCPSLLLKSFNDVRLILNTAQVKVLAQKGVKLITFDGDVTLVGRDREVG